MSNSFIIWTMQRSGGTSLASMLETLGEYPKLLHEPFNGNQVHGSVVRDCPKQNQGSKSEFYKATLEKIEAENPGQSFKHCYEVHDSTFNECLLNFARDTGRKNVILQRQNNFDRQLSLSFAKATGAWSKSQLSEQLGENESDWTIPEIDIDSMIKHEAICRKKELEIIEKVSAYDDSIIVSYETLYHGGFAERCLEIDRILEILGVESTSENKRTKEIEDILMFQKQGSNGIYNKIPNLAQAITAFESEFGMPNGVLAQSA